MGRSIWQFMPSHLLLPLKQREKKGMGSAADRIAGSGPVMMGAVKGRP